MRDAYSTTNDGGTVKSSKGDFKGTLGKVREGIKKS